MNGSARNFHLDRVRIDNLRPIISENLSRDAWLVIDEGIAYKSTGSTFASHVS